MFENLKQVFYYGSTLGYFSFEHFNCFLCCEVMLACGFDLHFTVLDTFSCICWLSVFVKMSVQLLCPVFNWIQCTGLSAPYLN